MTEDFFTEDIGYEPVLKFTNEDNKILPKVELLLKNGSPDLIKELDAIRQWILKFALTEKDTYEIYEGTGFGCRIRKLFGEKQIGYGYEEAELERDFREGLPLCPAISQVTNFEISKEGKTLNINVEVELFNGELVEVSLDKIYEIGGYDVIHR